MDMLFITFDYADGDVMADWFDGCKAHSGLEPALDVENFFNEYTELNICFMQCECAFVLVPEENTQTAIDLLASIQFQEPKTVFALRIPLEKNDEGKIHPEIKIIQGRLL